MFKVNETKIDDKNFYLNGQTYENNRMKVCVGDQTIGGNTLTMIAGPCAIESEEQINSIAVSVKKAGAKFLRGGAYKPRTSPYSFQGLQKDGLIMIKKAADSVGLKVVSEVTSEKQLDFAAKYCDMFQIGAKNMQNFELLKAVGRYKIPVLLKRSFGAKIDEWLAAAEYIIAQGNRNIVLCERGIRTFETSTRNTLDISAIPVIREKSPLPIIIDPSHASGKSKYVHPLSLAAIAAGADGLIIEVHNNPKAALCDSEQQITPDDYSCLFNDVKKIANVVGRNI